MELTEFERLCETTYTRVFRAAFLILGNRQEALDVAQETFARAFARWGKVRAMESPEGWLIKVAVNQSISLRRRAWRRAFGPPPEVPSDPPEASDPALASALGALTPAQRAAVIVRYYLDMSVQDASQALGKRPGTVRALTSQGVARLREILGPEWLEDRDERPVP
jgi:RNA polymerase sigma factor (sigma-70 family)